MVRIKIILSVRDYVKMLFENKGKKIPPHGRKLLEISFD